MSTSETQTSILDIRPASLAVGRKYIQKGVLYGEIKYTFKVRITELDFEASETNRDPEKLSNLELECGY